MRGGLALSLVATLLAAGCLQTAADLDPATLDPEALAEGLAPPIFEDGFVFDILHVDLDATLSIHAETFLPRVEKPLAGATPPEKFPTILVMSPYFGGGSGGEVPGHHLYAYLVEAMVPRGYAVVLADTAGQGGSSGCWDFMGPQEVRGAAGLVDAIAQQPWSDGKVGMVGKSYDAMTQIMAASQNPEALVTIVPVAPLTHAYAGVYQNGVHYGGGWHLTTTAYQSSSLGPPGADPLDVVFDPTGAADEEPALERYPGYAVRTLVSPPCAAQNAVLGNDPTGSYNAYFAERDLRPSAKDVKASVFFMQGFLDANVKPDNLLPYFTDLPGQKKAWLGLFHHDYPNATWAGREDMYLAIHRWFDHELKGIDNGIDREPAIDVQDSLGRWRHEEAWPPADVTPLTLALGADGAMLAEGAKEGAVSFGGPDDARDLVTGDGGGRAMFHAPVFDDGLHIAGSPRLALTVASDRPGGIVVARLWEVHEGKERLVTQGAFNLAFAGGLDAPRPPTPGEPVTVSFELYPADWAVPPGAELHLVLSTQDSLGWYDIDPTLATLTLRAVDTTLTLPTIARSDEDVFLIACGERLKEDVPSCFQEGRKDIGRPDAATRG